jgi:hypothetical protein
MRPLAEAASRRHNRSLHHLFATGVVDGRPGAPCVKGFYNNFELLRVDHFRESAVYSAWVADVAESGGIYRYRWGDAILRRIGLALMGARTCYLDELLPGGQQQQQQQPAKRLDGSSAASRVAPTVLYCHVPNRRYCYPESTAGARTFAPGRRA